MAGSMSGGHFVVTGLNFQRQASDPLADAPEISETERQEFGIDGGTLAIEQGEPDNFGGRMPAPVSPSTTNTVRVTMAARH